MNFRAWAKDTALRAVKTAAQTTVALLGVDQTKWLDVDLTTVAITAGFAAAASILQNVSRLELAGDPVPVVYEAAPQIPVTPVE